MATARTADAVAICAAGGKKICDDRLPLRRLMQSSGKRLLPRLGVSATNSPIPQHGRTVDVRWQSPGPGRGQIRLSTPATLGGGSAHCNNQSLIYEIVDPRQPSRLFDLCIGRAGPPVGDIVAHRKRKDQRRLQHHRDLAAQRFELVFAQIDPVDLYYSRRWIKK